MIGRLLRFEAVLLLVALLYIFSPVDHPPWAVKRGILILLGLFSAALIETRIVCRDAASLPFYLRLPVGRFGLLLLFYAATTIPFLAALFLLFRLGTAADLFPKAAGGRAVLNARLSEVLFAYLFFRSLSVNVMIAIGTSFLLIGAYLAALSGVVVLLLWLQEIVAPLVVLTPAAMAVLFLAATFAISYLSVRWVRL